MDTQQLLAFDRIAREGSFVRAAVSLELAQATVSARIQALEREVGGPLFVRGRRVRLTERGERFLVHARRALAVLGEGVEAARGAPGRVTVTSVESLAGALLAGAVRAYRRAFPEAEIVAQAAPCGQVVHAVLDGAAGLGLLPWPYPGAGTELAPLARFTEPVVAVCAPAHPLARAARPSAADVVRDGRPFLPVWMDEASDAALAPLAPGATRLELPAQTVRHLLLGGTGAAFLTRALVADDLAAGRLVALDLAGDAPRERGFALVRPDRPAPPTDAERAFADALRTAARDLGLGEATG